MKLRNSLVLAGAVLAFSPVAMAQEETQADPGQSCEALQSQYDQQAATAASDKISEAQAAREEGGKLCAEGKTEEGAAKLKEALSLLQGGATAPQAPQS
jgi:hypothetical protein